MATTIKNKALALLQKGYPRSYFKEDQWETIEDVFLYQKRLLLVKRTGWGKSIIYFITTALLKEYGSGPTLVISPLLSLMRNQVETAKRLNIKAVTVNSSNSTEWEVVRKQLLRKEIDLLLISPERLANNNFRERFLIPIKENIGLFVIDEAHCISDWGHDFRPDYRRIVTVLNILPPDIPVIALTATANDRVVKDIIEQLGDSLECRRGPLTRDSLYLQNIIIDAPSARLAWLSSHLNDMPGSGIIYTLTVRDSTIVAEWLRQKGFDAHAYSGRLDSKIRKNLEQDLMNNKIKALVSTEALGMGFDKDDIGFVIHYQRPGSVIHYYQQVGRAGRQIDKAYCIMLCGQEDEDITEYFINSSFPPASHVDKILNALEKSADGLTMPMLQKAVNLSKKSIDQVIKLLKVESPSPIKERYKRYYRNPVKYTIDYEKIESIKKIRRYEQERMREYMNSKECLMRFLSQELNDSFKDNCGKCANCQQKQLISEKYREDHQKEALKFLKENILNIIPKFEWPSGFMDLGGIESLELSNTKAETEYIKANRQHKKGKALCLWGDFDIGELIKSGKQRDKRFDERLVMESVSLIRNTWKPSPFPKWLTCVPSLNNIDLVPEFAGRLAKQLGIPFISCIEKINHTRPQKEMENEYYQLINLKKAFRINQWQGMNGPVLLVDDIVDSGWTFGILSYQLREAGSGPVFPFALAMATKGSR